MESTLRNRINKETVQEIDDKQDEIKKEIPKNVSYLSKNKIILSVLIILSILTRFYYIQHPSEVVFDEVHFGKFLSLYIRRSYFFDVHPPFSKLLYAFYAWIIGYDGHFLFEKIGDSYIKNNVPYIYLRSLPAFLGAMTVPLIFLIMKDSGHTTLSSILAASLVLFDNAQVTQSRLILLDSIFIFSMTSSLYCYVRFCTLKHHEFSFNWWKWLFLTGIFLSCTISTKYVGLFTYMTIGLMVTIELWNFLDIRKGYTMHYFAKHFIARAISLIIFPFILYLSWFYIHFNLLSKTGPGDRFMTPSFQETLQGNVLSSSSFTVHYYDKITIKHKETNVYLHSHDARYPLIYEDGRVSSQGQQVTGYMYNDTNSYWIIMPAYPSLNETRVKKPVLNNDYIRLKHVSTNTYLLTHDVASPGYPTNQEFTTISNKLKNRYNETVFQIKLEYYGKKPTLKTKGGKFKLIHRLTGVALYSNTDQLPDWGFKQQEVNGSKKVKGENTIWFVDDIVGMNYTNHAVNKTKYTSLPFYKKYAELQYSMLRHNNLLTGTHPYSSYPAEWPLLNRGISFWTNNPKTQQIYLLGNPIGWWFSFSLIIVFVIVVIADQLLLQRDIKLIKESRKLFYNYTLFFFFSWIFHYFPFYLMNRKLFLHHYLPAQITSSLLSGSVFQLVFEKNNKSLISLYFDRINKNKTNIKPNLNQPSKKSKILFVLLMSSLLICFIFFSPLTYGKPGLTSDELRYRQWSPNWDYAHMKYVPS